MVNMGREFGGAVAIFSGCLLKAGDEWPGPWSVKIWRWVQSRVVEEPKAGLC